MTYTIEGAKLWAVERRAELDAQREAVADQLGLKLLGGSTANKVHDLWDCAIWLAITLRRHGVPDSERHVARFCSGQRGFAGSAWEAAVDFANDVASVAEGMKGGSDDLHN